METSFLQSEGWGAFQRSLGKQVRRDGCQLIRQELGFGFHYWYCPRGELKTLPTDGLFVRMDPLVERYDRSARPAPHFVQPPTSLLLNLTQTQEELLAQMHEKTRYNIRLSERNGVTVGTGDVEEFLALMQETSRRDQFRAHGDDYYRTMLADHGDPRLKIFLVIARREGRALAAGIFCDYEQTRTYLHGASSYEERALMAPYALHWKMILEAKAKGLRVYDFWGIAASEDPGEPLAGVTRFKKGFGGKIVRYPTTIDLVLKPWQYRAYRLVHSLRSRSSIG